ncbi:MAG: ATP-binding protein, partial [Candidatus Omnitrophica bacterium]|nr:ATP-binding protein [Candidatus Omnitrophota bacterium]
IPQDLNQLIEETVSLLEHELMLRGIKVIRNYSSDIPLVFLEPAQIKQVFINLILNAHEAMSKGGELRITTETDGDFGVAIKFSDTGCGIKRENIDKIFNVFFTTKEASGGAGLGLAVSQEIVKGCKGTIGVESVEDKGAVFTIRLPLPGKSSNTKSKAEASKEI